VEWRRKIRNGGSDFVVVVVVVVVGNRTGNRTLEERKEGRKKGRKEPKVGALFPARRRTALLVAGFAGSAISIGIEGMGCCCWCCCC